MPEKDFNTVFSKRLKYYLDKYDMTQLELSKKLGVGTTSVYNWCNAIKTPRMDKVDAMCDIFHCNRSDLMEEHGDNDKLELNKHDERDVEKRLQATLDDLEHSQEALMFSGEPLDDETKQLLKLSLKNSLDVAKINAKKFTPNKYKKD